MIFNLAQKYASVFCTVANTFIIIQQLGLENLGRYAFITSSSALVAVVAQLSLRSVYLKEIVRTESDPILGASIKQVTEVLPKIAGLVILLGLVPLLQLNKQNAEIISSVALSGIFLGSAQLSSAKLRVEGVLFWSQMALNIRPIVMTTILLSAYILPLRLERNLELYTALSFFCPAFIFYLALLLRGRLPTMALGKFLEDRDRVTSVMSDAPAIGVLALGKNILSKSDSIVVGSVLGMEALGLYRVALQIVTLANSSLYPIRTAFIMAYSKKIAKRNDAGRKEIELRASKLGGYFFVGSIIIVIAVAQSVPQFPGYSSSNEFLLAFTCLSLLGYARARTPMLDNYIVHRGASKYAAKLMVGVAVFNILSCTALSYSLGLVGAAVAALVSFLIWRALVQYYC